MEILAHISSRARKDSDERHIRQATALLQFEAGKIITMDRETAMKRSHDGEDAVDDISSKRRKTSQNASLALTNPPKTASQLQSQIDRLPPNTQPTNSSPKYSQMTLKMSFSDLIGLSPRFLPPSPLKLLELASKKWKGLRGNLNEVASSANEDPSFEDLTENDSLDTQAGLTCLQDEIGSELKLMETSSLVDVNVRYADHVTLASVPAGDSIQNLELSYLPSDLSSCEPSSSGLELVEPQRDYAMSSQHRLSMLAQANHSTSFLSEEFYPRGPQHTVEPTQFSSVPLDKSSFQTTQLNDSEKSSQSFLASGSGQAPLPPFSELPMGVESPPPDSEFMAKEGIINSNATKSLQVLISDPNLSSKYNPVKEKRQLANWERGFWLLSLAHWPVENQVLFWTCIVDFIRKGNGGLGTWAIRIVKRDGVQTTSPRAQQDYELGDVRVYCYGGIAKEVYLFCHLASSSFGFGKGAQWLSAISGEVVVYMDTLE
jgi:hypothetical protein